MSTNKTEKTQPRPKSRAKVCTTCEHRAGRHSKGWGCEVIGCDCIEQPPFQPVRTPSGQAVDQ